MSSEKKAQEREVISCKIHGYRFLEAMGGELVLIVSCGRRAYHEVRHVLNEEEIEMYHAQGETYLGRLAREIAADESRHTPVFSA